MGEMKDVKFRFVNRIKQTGEIQFVYTSINELEGEDSWQGAVNYERIGINLSTSLKDKNGKDLYEGDVLRTLHFQTESTINYMFHKVVYNEGRGTFNAINVMNEDEELTTNGNCFLYVALKDKTCEVIGNVFETPELLKV